VKYSKATRELAAVRCQVIADYWIRKGPRPDAYGDYTSAWAAVMLCSQAYDLADTAAWDSDALPSEQIATRWAEAEALIRTGWSPP
jgi:hypothetical protein